MTFISLLFVLVGACSSEAADDRAETDPSADELEERPRATAEAEEEARAETTSEPTAAPTPGIPNARDVMTQSGWELTVGGSLLGTQTEKVVEGFAPGRAGWRQLSDVRIVVRNNSDRTFENREMTGGQANLFIMLWAEGHPACEPLSARTEINGSAYCHIQVDSFAVPATMAGETTEITVEQFHANLGGRDEADVDAILRAAQEPDLAGFWFGRRGSETIVEGGCLVEDPAWAPGANRHLIPILGNC